MRYKIVIGDYLYIDGGEINFYDNGVPTHLPGLPISNTLPRSGSLLTHLIHF
jgi:hypothetical protein